MITILAYDSTGQVTVAIRGKRYTYFGMSPFVLRKIKLWIAHGRFGLVFKTLELFSDRSRYIKGAA